MDKSESVELSGVLDIKSNPNVVMYNEVAKETFVENNNPVPVFAAEMKIENSIPRRLIPYTSYLSQMNSKPVDLKISSILQTTPISDDDEILMWVETPTVINIDSSDEDVENVKMESASIESNNLLQQEATPITVSNYSDDDEILMWVETPTVINIDSSDDNSNSGDTTAKLENGSMEPNLLQKKKRSYTDVSNLPDKSKNVIAHQCSVNNKEKRIKRTKSSSGSNRLSDKTNSDYTTDKNDVKRETFVNAGHGESSLSSCHSKSKKLKVNEILFLIRLMPNNNFILLIFSVTKIVVVVITLNQPPIEMTGKVIRTPLVYSMR